MTGPGLQNWLSETWESSGLDCCELRGPGQGRRPPPLPCSRPPAGAAPHSWRAWPPKSEAASARAQWGRDSRWRPPGRAEGPGREGWEGRLATDSCTRAKLLAPYHAAGGAGLGVGAHTLGAVRPPGWAGGAQAGTPTTRESPGYLGPPLFLPPLSPCGAGGSLVPLPAPAALSLGLSVRASVGTCSPQASGCLGSVPRPQGPPGTPWGGRTWDTGPEMGDGTRALGVDGEPGP